MTTKQTVLAIVLGGIVANALDIIVHGFLLNPSYAEASFLFRTDFSPLWLTLGDFVSVGVFVWVYTRVRSCFAAGAAGGAAFGFYAGVLIGFPTHIFLNLVLVEFSYGLAWAWTINEIVWCVAIGSIIGRIAGGRNAATAGA